MATIKGGARRSQIVTTYGVGAIVALEDESFMVAGLEEWPVSGAPDLHEKRLARKLGVFGFRRPPASGKSKYQDVPVVRFPKVYFCPGCDGRLEEHRRFSSPDKNRCNSCGEIIVPSRFVIVCEKGHIDDFPYFEWVHKGTSKRGDREAKVSHLLKIKTGGTSASLSDIEISCSCGVPTRTMEGAFSKLALKGIKKCTGYRPWLGDRELPCECTPRTLQRGASNVYFSIVDSALSIPPWSEGAFKLLNNHWTVLRAIPDEALAGVISAAGMTKNTAYTPDELADAVRARKKGEAEGDESGKDLRGEEYEALCLGKPERSRDQDFVCVSAQGTDPRVNAFFDKVMLATRLREVRALRGFTRLLPPAGLPEDVDRAAKLSKEKLDWLPAIEVRGEGIFLRLSIPALIEWETRAAVKERAARININYRRRCEQFGVVPPRVVTARLVMIHTLAHVLINQWSLDCGYPAGSLRERLFVTSPDVIKPMAGLLIYTATSDAAGSLGGVTALGVVNRLGPALREAMENASWCSSDPLCIEADATGADSLNLAACHACVLLPEVSCEEGNGLLDRGLLVGTLEQPDLGYFSPLVRQT